MGCTSLGNAVRPQAPLPTLPQPRPPLGARPAQFHSVPAQTEMQTQPAVCRCRHPLRGPGLTVGAEPPRSPRETGEQASQEDPTGGASAGWLKMAGPWLCDSRLGGSTRVPVKPPSETPQGQGLDSRTAGPGNGLASQQRAAHKTRGGSQPLLQKGPRPEAPPTGQQGVSS